MTEQLKKPVPVSDIPPPRSSRHNHRDALEGADSLALLLENAKTIEQTARQRLYDEVVRLVEAGVPKTYVAEAAGLSRTQVDRVLGRQENG